MAENYTPDPNFYDRQLKDLKDAIKELEGLSYSSEKNGYVLSDGKVIKERQRQSRIRILSQQIAAVEADKKKYGRYGPEYGDNVEEPAAGARFRELYDAATSIEVSDWDSSLEAIKAWQDLQRFLADNPNLRVKVRRDAVVVGERGRSVVKPITVLVDPTKDTQIARNLKSGLPDAISTARSNAETGAVENRVVVKGRGAAATRSTQRIVVNQELLDSRIAELEKLSTTPAKTSTTTKLKDTTSQPSVVPSKSTTTTEQGKPSPTAPGKTSTGKAKATSPQSLRAALEGRPVEPVSTEDTGAGGGGGTGGAGTGGGGAGGGGNRGQGAGTKTPKLTDAQVDAEIRKNYPQFAYMLDNPDLFGADVIKIMRRAAKYDWPADRFQSAIFKTNYWQTTAQAARNFDGMSEADRQTLIEKTRQEIDQYTDTSVVDESVLLTFSRDMARRGLSGDSLRPLAFKFAFDQGAATEAAQEALVSQTAQGIRQVARAYGQRLEEAQLETLLASGETANSMQRKYLAKLKAQYPYLKDQLDAGLTFVDITDDYRSVASSILEQPSDSIDFMDPKYMEAIAEPDGKGGYRQLSLGEWQKKLKTDDRYGYAKTTQAVQDARVLASSIARSFGKVI